MRDFPAGWPDSNGDDTTPEVYLHLLDSSWPPASDDCPAGYAKVGTWNVDRDLVGSLLPGQVRASSGFSVATGNATIPQVDGERLAPWKSGDRRVVPPARAELIASFDGPTGSTAFILGTFKVDPISGRMSEANLSFELIEEWSSLKKRHAVHQIMDPDGGGLGFPIPEDPTTGFTTDAGAYVEQIAEEAGFEHDIPALGNTMSSIYFPPDPSALDCLQQVIAANLGAAFVASDGRTIKGLTFEQLSGADGVVEEIDVLTKFADLEWKIDPNEAVDRVVLQYSPPIYHSLADATDTDDERVLSPWVAPDKSYILSGGSRGVIFDPGSAVGFMAYTVANTAADGSGSDLTVGGGFSPGSANDQIQVVSTGRVVYDIKNDNGVKAYLVGTDGKPSYIVTNWRDTSGSDGGKVVVWGADESAAQNPLTIDFGRLIQNSIDARRALDRIVSRVRYARWRINSVSVKVDLRREIGDLVWISFPEEGLSTKALVTSVSNSGGDGGFEQVLDLAILAPLVQDFDAAFDAAHPGWTVADFDAFWNAKFPGATLDDFDLDPLGT